MKKLDSAGKTSLEAEDELVAMGDEAIDDLLQSVAEINGRLNKIIQDKQLYPLSEMAKLERRVRVMGRMKNPLTLKTLFDALADSAIAVEECSQDRKIAYEQGNMMASTIIEDFIQSAKSLKKATIKALVAFGKPVVPHAQRYLNVSQPPVIRAFKKVISQVEVKWWKF